MEKSQAKEKMNEWRIEEMNQQINDDESMIKESMAQRTKEAMNTEYVSPWIHESRNESWIEESTNQWVRSVSPATISASGSEWLTHPLSLASTC